MYAVLIGFCCPLALGAQASGGQAAQPDQPGEGPAEATSAATASTSPSAGFLGFPSKVAFHETAGFVSGALLAGAGIAGGAQWLWLMAEGHAYRDANDIDEDSISSQCAGYILGRWQSPDHQALRWTHVGLLAAGSLLYTADAVTGLGMITPHIPGTITRGEIHRAAFFIHGTLMVSEIVLGILTTMALSSGSHWQLVALGGAHLGVGIAIPALVIGSGLAMVASSP